MRIKHEHHHDPIPYYIYTIPVVIEGIRADLYLVK